MNTPLQNIGKYQILAELGRGANGVVYKAQDALTKHDVAIKVFHPKKFTLDEQHKQFNKLFLAAGEIASSIHHPYIVRTYEAQVEGDLNYIVMELVHGTALQAHVKVGHLLSVQNVLQLMLKCCEALEQANQQGAVHRNIKPSNILYTQDGEIKITDFGTASLNPADYARVTDIPVCISPEQAIKAQINHQTDIYSLGVVMYRLFTGHLPFAGDDSFHYVENVIHEAPFNIRDLRPELPEKLAAIVHRMLEKNLVARYAKWADVAKDMESSMTQVENENRIIADSEKIEALRKLAFFDDFSDIELWEVIRISEWARFLTGKTLVKEGDFGTSFFMLVKGKVTVSKMGKTLTTLERGACFGEMAYIDKSKAERSASIVSAMPVTLMKIRSEVLEQSSEQIQLRFNRAFLKILVHRLALANANIASRFDPD